ncbi:MAG: hypothetical protein E3J66_02320 [Dehalococcoidia bacterium]|nr:MAG: hypothetical protein E3J66_02320 [Dehalococcoidia bacterium]
MNHTPSEWKAYKNALGTWSISTDVEPIAQVERHYNAHLIAAAPLGAELARAIIAQDKDGLDRTQWILDKAKEFQSKAEGG